MVIFTRALEGRIRERLFGKDMIIVYGPRQSGKTTLVKKIVADFGEDGMYYDCQLADVRKHFVVGKLLWPKRRLASKDPTTCI